MDGEWKLKEETWVGCEGGGDIFSCHGDNTIQYNFIAKCQYTDCTRGMFCGAKYTHDTFTLIIKH